jgi:hypothetical protein
LIGPESHSGSQAFVGSECAGQRIWLHAPPGKVSEALAWYQEQKAKSPHNTSACVVVQQWRKAPYKAQLAGMRLIHQVPAGQALLSTASADGAPTAVPSPHTLRVYYDSPLLLSAARVPGPAPTTDMLMKFDGTAAGHPATVALDTMASHCFVSAAWAARAGIAVQPTNDKVLLAAGAPQGTAGHLQCAPANGGVARQGVRFRHAVAGVP